MRQATTLSDRTSEPVSNDTDRPGSDPCSTAGSKSEFRQYASPARHGEAFVEPGLDEVQRMLDENVQRLSSPTAAFASYRDRARRQLIEDAIRYTSAYRDVDWATKTDSEALASGPIMMAGHQPAIFHPGVWFKNFVLSRLARRSGATAVNLVIDNDVASGSSIRVPTLDSRTGRATYTTVRYDRAGGGVPYEQTTIDDREMFDTFDSRVRHAVAPLVDDPSVTGLWHHARTAIERCGIAGCALAQARHGLEGELGLETLEIPLGVVCRTTAFAEFVLSILCELPRFQQCYNDAADRYRRAHRIRSSAHPVPNLGQREEWFEAPLWIYGDDSPQRQPAWVQLRDDVIVISDLGSREIQIDTQYPKLAAEQLASLGSPDFKLRPRALLTTMYARLVLSDLFLHGIGGGKYDQLGDIIMRTFFMIEPPRFMVVSATVQLPLHEWTDDTEKIRSLKRRIRDTRYGGERFADQVSLSSDLVTRKRALLESMPPKGRRKAWHDQITDINERLAEELTPLRDSLRVELAAAEREAASRKLLASREHPFCVFPLSYLVETYQRMLATC